MEKKQDRWVLTQPHLYAEDVVLCLTKADGVLPVEDVFARATIGALERVQEITGDLLTERKR